MNRKKWFEVTVEQCNGSYDLPISRLSFIVSQKKLLEFMTQQMNELPENSKGRQVIDNYIEIWLK